MSDFHQWKCRRDDARRVRRRPRQFYALAHVFDPVENRVKSNDTGRGPGVPLRRFPVVNTRDIIIIISDLVFTERVHTLPVYASPCRRAFANQLGRSRR